MKLWPTNDYLPNAFRHHQLIQCREHLIKYVENYPRARLILLKQNKLRKDDGENNNWYIRLINYETHEIDTVCKLHEGPLQMNNMIKNNIQPLHRW